MILYSLLIIVLMIVRPQGLLGTARCVPAQEAPSAGRAPGARARLSWASSS